MQPFVIMCNKKVTHCKLWHSPIVKKKACDEYMAKAAAIWFFTNQALLMETLCTRFFTFPQNNIF